jgi:hypothetical protein
MNNFSISGNYKSLFTVAEGTSGNLNMVSRILQFDFELSGDM